MKTKFFIASILFFCLMASASFAQKRKMQPIDYNDKLAAITDSLYNMGIEWAGVFQEISESDKNYSRLAASRKKIAVFTSRKMEEVRRGPTAGKGAEDLKSAMLKFLAFEKTMIDGAFAPLEKLNNTSTQTELDDAIKKLAAEAEKEAEVLKEVNVAQERFGELNGFTLEAPDESAGE